MAKSARHVWVADAVPVGYGNVVLGKVRAGQRFGCGIGHWFVIKPTREDRPEMGGRARPDGAGAASARATVDDRTVNDDWPRLSGRVADQAAERE
ncbi:MAG: hypothetical protein JWO38_2009 [Gemmataceae bacterium]|nr:hypothetical protein [Gemmataceae bacterium]